MCLILHCLNETRDLFNIIAAQTVENSAQQRLLFALFWPSPIFRSHIQLFIIPLQFFSRDFETL